MKSVQKIPKLGTKDPNNRWNRGDSPYKEVHKVPVEGGFADLIDLAHAHGVAGWAFLNHATKKFYGFQNTNDLGLCSDLDEECRPKFPVLKVLYTTPAGIVDEEPLMIFILDEGLSDVDGIDDPELTLEEVVQGMNECHHIPS